MDLRYRDADTGAILSAAEVDRLIPPDRLADGDWLAAHFPAVLYGVPGSRYREVDATLGGLGLVLGTAAASAAMVLVPRRRP